MSAFSRPQFTQKHSNIFFTFTMKPVRKLLVMNVDESQNTYPDETQASPTRYDRNDLDTPTYPLRRSDT